MSAVAEFPSYIKNSLFVTKKVAKDGKYQVKLFDGRSKKWKLVEIDDYLPCTSWGGEMPQLLFGSIPDGKLCLALLEKAFAKLYGNWSNLSAGFPEIAWFHMTGCTELFSYSTSYLGVEPKWQVTSADGVQVMAGYWGYEESRKVVGRLSEGATFGEKCRIGHWIEFRKIDGDGPDSGWLKYYGNGKRVAKRTAANDIAIMQSNVVIVPEKAMTAIGASGANREVLEQAFRKNSVPNFVEPEELWQKLQKCDKGNYLMASSASTSKHERMSGLVHEHAYSVLHAVEVEGLRLVCCRNPWGSEAEWNGPWSDRSPEWKANPSIVEALNVDLFDFKTEGTFWMDFEDWLYVMGQLKIMNCRMPSTRGGFHHELVEEDEDEQAENGKEEDEANEDDHQGEPVTSCSGLFVDWHPPETLTEGTLLYPDKTYTFTNVPPVLLGGTYIGSQDFPNSGGTWTIEYAAPAKLFVWAAQGQFNGGVDEALQADGWEAEDPDGFHGGALALNLWSKRFDQGSSCDILLTSDTQMVGGVVGTAPCVQEKD